MPIPIKPYHELPWGGESSGTSTNMGNFFLDYESLYTNLENTKKKEVTASNKDASILFKIWQQGKKTNNKIRITNELGITSSDVLRLKANGFLTGGADEVSFTPIGRKIITTMSLGEENAFMKNRKQKSFHEILASMDKRGKQGYRIAFCNDGFITNLGKI